MKQIEELLIGVVLFFIVDRGARLVSSIVSARRELSDMETEKFRCTIETLTLLTLFFILWYRLKR